MDNITVGEKYRLAVGKSKKLLEELPLRRDGSEFQYALGDLIAEFTTILSIVDSLSLFSDNESLDEINVAYIPFANIDFYLSQLYMNYLLDSRKTNIDVENDKLRYKLSNLEISQNKILHFLVQLQAFGVLTKTQSDRLNGFNSIFHPSYDEIMAQSGNPASKRAEKIANYRLEKELSSKLELLDQYYAKNTLSEEDSLSRFDDEIAKSIFVDQLKLHAIHAFNNLELTAMELLVLSKKPQEPPKPESKQKEPENKHGFTTRLESLPQKQKVGDLLSKQGKILQPFTITSDRQKLKQKVFGTGQVLPSMSVEEYLDYELANGKMLKSQEEPVNEDDSDNSDDEVEKRRWDDWKDENPKGSGNLKGNLG